MRLKLNVLYDGKIVGRIIKDAASWTFTYDRRWVTAPEAFPVSVSMPLQREPFSTEITRAFFANLLPESQVRDAIARHFGFSGKNDFELLKAIGGECAGALSVVTESQKTTKPGGYLLLKEGALREMIRKSSQRPLLIGREGLRLSLAGAQHKIPVYIKDKAYYLPKGDSASTHIIKPKIEQFEGAVENEYFCMLLAKAAGLNVPGVRIETGTGAQPFLVVNRYDRRRVGRRVIRLHQEDFCQALSCSYDQKYESEGGPGLSECFALLERVSANPVLDKKQLLGWVIFNFAIGNAEAHAKNISLLYDKRKIVLAPFYDLLSTAVYPELVRKMAMKIGGEGRLTRIKDRHWQRFSGEAGVKDKMVAREKERMFSLIKIKAAYLREEFGKKGYACGTIDKIIGHIEASATG